MKNRVIAMILTIFIVMSSSIVFGANSNDYDVIAGISNRILNVLTWFGYAIMLGMLIFIGIKYAMSGANERANLKNIFPTYFLGAFFIIFALTLGMTIASLAGNNSAETIIDEGLKSRTNYNGGGGGTKTPAGGAPGNKPNFTESLLN